jgi:hypothetical protein
LERQKRNIGNRQSCAQAVVIAATGINHDILVERRHPKNLGVHISAKKPHRRVSRLTDSFRSLARKAAGRGLLVCIDQQDITPLAGSLNGKVDRDCGFTHAPFCLDNSDFHDTSHDVKR